MAGGAVALVAILAVVWASPAGAHPILLQTEPTAQTTLPTAPPACALDFSEPVEAAFGALRVSDFKGKAVPAGPVTQAKDGHEVAVSLPPLTNGTYTVTWRVVSVQPRSARWIRVLRWRAVVVLARRRRRAGARRSRRRGASASCGSCASPPSSP
ncbi:MAG: copper resistance protein CopC [Actinomycetota bacterium]|nr:copper resistance protein CopC [Actinomycetota bacterium]